MGVYRDVAGSLAPKLGVRECALRLAERICLVILMWAR